MTNAVLKEEEIRGEEIRGELPRGRRYGAGPGRVSDHGADWLPNAPTGFIPLSRTRVRGFGAREVPAKCAPDPAARHAELEATRERRTKMYDLIARKEQEIEAIIRRNPGRRGPIPALAEHERGSSRAKTSVAQTTFGCANALLLLQRQRARTQCEKQNLRSSRNSDERKTAHEPALGM